MQRSLNQQIVVPPVLSPLSSSRASLGALQQGISPGSRDLGAAEGVLGSPWRCFSSSLARLRPELPRGCCSGSTVHYKIFRLCFWHPRMWQRLGSLGMLRGSFPSGRPWGCSWTNIIFFWLQRALPTQSPMGAGSLLPEMLCLFFFANKNSRRFLLSPSHVQPRCFQLSYCSFQ